MEAIILVGGLGTRLRKVVRELPKPMAPIDGRPFLDYLLINLQHQGVKRVVLATGYLNGKIKAHYQKEFLGVEIDYAIEETPLGTGGGIRHAFSYCNSDEILILNGDTFFPVDLAALKKTHNTNDADLTIALKPVQNVSRYGIVKFSDSRITSFDEKQAVEHGHINGGVYLAKRGLFDNFDLPDRFSLEEDFLKPMASKLNVCCHVSDAYFIDIGIPEDYEKAQTELLKYAESSIP